MAGTGNPAAFPPTIQAILNADLIIIGPGSLYTSIIANLLVPDLVDAINASKAYKFYVCNVATEPGETDDFSCEDHVKAIEKHTRSSLFDLVMCNKRYEGILPQDIKWVKLEDPEGNKMYYQADLIDVDNPWRHDSQKLARTVMDLYFEKTGPLSSREETSALINQTMSRHGKISEYIEGGITMAIKVGINGFGRIGRQVLKAINEFHGSEIRSCCNK